MLNRLNKMIRMAVWDNQDRMYMPVWGYDNRISHYAKAKEANKLMIDYIEECRRENTQTNH